MDIYNESEAKSEFLHELKALISQGKVNASWSEYEADLKANQKDYQMFMYENATTAFTMIRPAVITKNKLIWLGSERWNFLPKI